MNDKELLLVPKPEVDHSRHDVGVVIARFQVPALSPAHRALIEYVSARHKKVVVLLGVSRVMYTKSDPLDFATREQMIKTDFPDVVILPILDQPSDKDWSKDVDKAVFIAYGERTALLYGGRDSFIPYYLGRNTTQELDTTGPEISGTKMRELASKELRNSFDWRAGSIHAINSMRDVSWMTVDIIPISHDFKRVLLGKRSTESLMRFIGGFVDREDKSLEVSASRELREESGLIVAPDDLIYVGSSEIADPRYVKTGSGIKTSLFLVPITESEALKAKGADDIEKVQWVNIEELINYQSRNKLLVSEHLILAQLFISRVPKLKIPYVSIPPLDREEELEVQNISHEK